MSSAAWFVPGRIEVLGKHTDYAGGRSLLAAVDRGVIVHGQHHDRAAITAGSSIAGDQIVLSAGVDPGLPAGHWGNYLQAVIDRLSLNFGDLTGCHISVDSTLPAASGMSSSSALVVGLSMVIAELNGFTDSEQWTSNIGDRIDLAGYLACVENGMTFKGLTGHRGVGTFGGSEDHTGMLCTQPQALGLFSFCPIRHEDDLPFGKEWSFVVLVSGVAAEKTGAAMELYNRAALATREIVQLWNQATGRADQVLADAVASSADAADRLRTLVAGRGYLDVRLNQFLEESDRIIPAAVAAFKAGRWDEFGSLVDESQHLAETQLGNQVPETIRLARTARKLGAVAASAFGAGFGGSVWALVPTSEAEDFAEAWLERHYRDFPEAAVNATQVITRPGEAAHPVPSTIVG